MKLAIPGIFLVALTACGCRELVRRTAYGTSPKGQTCPEGMALVGARFCIDRWEASLVEITSDGEQPFTPYESPEGRVVRALTVARTVPQG
ncbi:MAG: hypothetical protein M3O46_23445, partial [Myxococcota bacterium]|nr:hypothetical protein [Myxococcota bacterium]